MTRRQPLPRQWMMTDERQGDSVADIAARLPPGTGIVFRHYALAKTDRRALFERLRTIARRRRLVLLLAASDREARRWGADGSHNLSSARLPGALRSAPVHSRSELRRAERGGADLIFLSPLFATRSHPGTEPLGVVRFRRIARAAKVPVIALGGVDAPSAQLLKRLHAYGWAGIDAWMIEAGSA